MLSWLRWLITVVLAIVAIAAGGLFTLQNTEAVPLDLLLIQFPAQPLSLWLLLTLFLGALLGIAAGSLLLLRKRTQLLLLRRERDRLATEVDRLRKVGITAGD
jgi:putative membrane protein